MHCCCGDGCTAEDRGGAYADRQVLGDLDGDVLGVAGGLLYGPGDDRDDDDEGPARRRAAASPLGQWAWQIWGMVITPRGYM